MSKNNILKRLSPIHIVALICAVVILATVGVSAGLLISSAIKNNKKEFNYMNEDLAQYIDLKAENYASLTVSPEYNELRDVDIQHTILNLVAGEKNYSSAETTQYNTNTIINVGDVVNLYYRGYILDDEGQPKYVDGMSNLIGSTYTTMSAYSLSIGGDSFIAGFSLALDGAKVGDYPFLERQRGDVTIDNTMVAFVSYTRYPITTNKYSHVETQGSVETQTGAFVDLTLGKDEIDATYGEGFYERLVGNGIASGETGHIAAAKADGENVINSTTGLRTQTADGADYKYTRISVEYAIAANYYEGYEPIEVEFPANYSSTELAGKTAYFQIMIESVKEYKFDGLDKDAVVLSNTAVINPILKKALAEDEDFMATVTLPEEGEEDTNDYYALYTQYLKDQNEEDYLLANENALYQAIIDKLVEITDVTADHPELEAKYNASLITFRSSYAENGTNYATIEEYAEAVIGGDHYITVGEGEDAVKVFDWKAAVKQLSVDYFTERMVVYQIIKNEGLYSKEAYDAAYEKVCNDYSEEYRKSYCKTNGIDIDDMTVQEKQAVDAAVKTYLYSNLGYEYLADRAYYQLVFDYFTAKDANGDYIRLTIE